MFHLRVVVCAFAATLLPSLASADDGDLWLGPAAMVCSSLYSGFEGTPLGSSLARMPEFQEAVGNLKASAAKCFYERKWVSKEFCTELMNLDPEANPKLDALTARYPQDITGVFGALGCDKGS